MTVRRNEGVTRVWIAACAQVVLPEGVQLGPTLPRVTMEDAGSSTQDAYTSVTITPKGRVFGPATPAP